MITATDVLGRAAGRAVHPSGWQAPLRKPGAHVMTLHPAGHLAAQSIFSHAKVGQLIATMKQLGQSAHLVVEHKRPHWSSRAVRAAFHPAHRPPPGRAATLYPRRGDVFRNSAHADPPGLSGFCPPGHVRLNRHFHEWYGGFAFAGFGACFASFSRRIVRR